MAWSALGLLCERARVHRPIAWDFPVLAAQAVGGGREAAIPAVGALTCAHMALILIDDLLDEDPRGAYHQLGQARAANLASALAALGIDVLLKSSLSQRERAAAMLNELMLRTAHGQDLDVQNSQTEEAYWAVTRAKSSPYFGAGLYLGALCADANIELAGQLKEFGELFGEIMQIHDDLNDCLATPANVDWLQGRSPLPILFAIRVAHPQQDRFIELRGGVSDPAALAEAQAILVSCGAISYSVNELVLRQGQAKRLLATIHLADPAPLASLLASTIAPVKHLFAKVGAEFPASL
jgi:geranylgeranyl diphosphate synthase type I